MHCILSSPKLAIKDDLNSRLITLFEPQIARLWLQRKLLSENQYACLFLNEDLLIIKEQELIFYSIVQFLDSVRYETISNAETIWNAKEQGFGAKSLPNLGFPEILQPTEITIKIPIKSPHLCLCVNSEGLFFIADRIEGLTKTEQSN
jgi:hypothetical protein